jgi:hypothetical protein
MASVACLPGKEKQNLGHNRFIKSLIILLCRIFLVEIKIFPVVQEITSFHKSEKFLNGAKRIPPMYLILSQLNPSDISGACCMDCEDDSLLGHCAMLSRKVDRRFSGAYCLLIALMIKAAGISETSVIYQTPWGNIPQVKSLVVIHTAVRT